VKNSRTYKNHLILTPLTSIMLSSGEKEDAPSVKAPGAFVVLGGGSVPNINLVIDASDAQRIIDQVAEALSPEQIDRLMFRTLKEVGNKTRTETGRAVSTEYAVTKGWAMARMGAPKMGGGGGSWSCVIPMRDRRGSIGGTFKLMGWHRGSKRKIGRVRAKIYRGGASTLPSHMSNYGGNPPFVVGGLAFVRKTNRAHPIAGIVDIAMPQMPLNKSKPLVEQAIQEAMVKRLTHNLEHLFGG